MRKYRKVLATLLSAAMLSTLIPSAALASEAVAEEEFLMETAVFAEDDGVDADVFIEEVMDETPTIGETDEADETNLPVVEELDEEALDRWDEYVSDDGAEETIVEDVEADIEDTAVNEVAEDLETADFETAELEPVAEETLPDDDLEFATEEAASYAQDDEYMTVGVTKSFDIVEYGYPLVYLTVETSGIYHMDGTLAFPDGVDNSSFDCMFGKKENGNLDTTYDFYTDQAAGTFGLTDYLTAGTYALQIRTFCDAIVPVSITVSTKEVPDMPVTTELLEYPLTTQETQIFAVRPEADGMYRLSFDREYWYPFFLDADGDEYGSDIMSGSSVEEGIYCFDDVKLYEGSTYYVVMRVINHSNPEALPAKGLLRLERLAKSTFDPNGGKFWLNHFFCGI